MSKRHLNLELAVKAEQAKYLYDNFALTAVAALLAACFATWTSWHTVPHALLLAWLAAMCLHTLYRFIELYRWASGRYAREPDGWLRQAVVDSAIAGCLWGLAAAYLLASDNLPLQFATLYGCALLTVAVMFSYGVHYPAFLSFFLPLMLPVVAVLASRQSIVYAGVAGAAAIFTVVGLRVGARFNRNLLDSLRLRFENLDLIERLREETKKAESASAAKSKFLAAASHDLRQPIHALGLFLEVLGRGQLSDTQRKMLDNARTSAEASVGMLNTLLDFSRIEAGVVTPRVRPFHLQPLLNKIESELAPQAINNGLVFRTRETHAAALSDPVLVELILRNLVSNAIRYTEQGGVLLACRARGNNVWLEVWDSGIGIAAAQQQEIFREFHQLGNPERDRAKGLGLGLAIVEGLTRTLGHQLALKSIPQHGSVFRLVLPISRVAVMSDEAKTLTGIARKLHARVLVIDDDEAVRSGMRQLLQDWGCECVVLESIEAALLAARAQQPDVVISDYRLREQRTGAEAISALRAACGEHLPALLITGDTAPERLREAIASNVPLLHKPVSPDNLYRHLEAILPR